MKNIKYNHYELNALAQSEIVCGVDEVGRGCLAGPVVVAAVILYNHKRNKRIKDSKLLNADQLEDGYAWIIKNSIYAVSIIHNRVIDHINIYQATRTAMKRAVIQLSAQSGIQPHKILVDAMSPDIPFGEIIKLYKGESKSISIAAASIVAKVTRDRLMRHLDKVFPHYALAAHKGYATPGHYAALQQKGKSIMHRDSFLKKWVTSQEQQLLFEPEEFSSVTLIPEIHMLEEQYHE